MGLLDSLVGAAADALRGGDKEPPQGGAAGGLGGLAALLPVVAGLLANNGQGGGLAGLVEKFNQAGLGDVIASWIGQGQNLPVSAQQLQDVLGGDTIGQVAGQLGVEPGQASEQLAQWLPDLVNKLTPEGQAPEGGLGGAGDLLGQLGSLLGPR